MSLLKNVESPEISDLPITGNKINICYASDSNYAKYLALSIATVLNSKNSDDDIRFYILDGGISAEAKQKILNLRKIAGCEIKFVTVDSEKFSNCPMNNSKHLTIASYYRLLMSDFLPDEVDKVLYLDCDVEVKSSLQELYNVELDDCCFAAVPDVIGDIQAERLNLKNYFNAGVLVVDLHKLREINFSSKVFEFINENSYKLKFHDQDVINIYFAGQIKELDAKWNCQGNLINKNFKNLIKSADIVHYVSTEKRDFVYMTLPLIFKTDFKYEFLLLYIGRIWKFIVQWLFRVRNYDETKKQITILGMDFYVKRKR